MQGHFDYFYTKTAFGQLQVDDIGDCCIQANNDEGLFYYLLIESNMGWVKILEYGPAAPDFDELPKAVTCNFNRIEYNEKQINKRIEEFLNNRYRNITQAQLVDREVLFADCKSILDYCVVKENF